MRQHPTFGDTAIAVLIALLDLTALSGGFAQRSPLPFWLVGALLVVPLVVRRRRPMLVAYVILAGGVLQLLTHGSAPEGHSLVVRPADLALGISLYTLVAYRGRRTALPYAAAMAAGTLAWALWRVVYWQHLDSDAVLAAATLSVGAVLIFVLSWVLGEFVGARRAYDDEVRERLKLVETERDQHTRIAVAAERTRIARELHDVVAHAVSVIVVQADGAAYAIGADPQLARAAVDTISATGREALVELRRLLDVLRRDDEPAGDRVPQPSIGALPELVEKVTEVGLPVELTLRGELDGLPAAVGLGLYRIVQEALTNTLKHAGPGARAMVRVQRVGGLVEVEVWDNGPVIAGATGTGLGAVSGGNGLIGMRERASVLGGTLDAGPLPGGGWRVRATFPVRPAEPSPLPSRT
jgi:signal transduction histidine kinase